MTLSNLARARLAAGRLIDAATAVRQALSAHRVMKNQQSVGNALNIAAELHLECGEIEEGHSGRSTKPWTSLSACAATGWRATGSSPSATSAHRRAARRLGLVPAFRVAAPAPW